MSSLSQVFEYHSTSHQVELPMQSIFLDKGTERVCLMLHGYFDKASSFIRRTFPHGKTPFSILAPNAPFPVPNLKAHEIREGYAWYFYNYISHKMIVSPDAAVKMLQDLILFHELENKRICILGFSQGGFLAPLIAAKLKNVDKIITVGAAYRDDFWNPPFLYRVHALHGDQDNIITLERAQETFKVIQKKGVQGDFHILKGLDHTLNEEAREKIYQLILNGE